MSERAPIELTPDEQREADEYNRLMDAAREVARQVNGPGARSIADLFPNAVVAGKMEEAAVSGKVWRVKLALNDGADPNEQNVTFGTALHAAALQGHLEVVRFLVEHGANASAPDGQGRTAAEAAALRGYAAVADFLRSLG